MISDRKKLFDRWSSNYDEELIAPKKFPFDGYDQVLSTVLALATVKPEMTILDVGIGTGNLAQYFVEAGCQVWGVDFSSQMIAQSRAKLPQVTLLVADILQGWPDGLPLQFDRIVSSYVLHEFTLAARTQWLYKLATQHLLPAGKIVIGDIMFTTVDIREMMKIKLADRWDNEEFYWAADEALTALEAVGLRCKYAQISSCGGVIEVAGL